MVGHMPNPYRQTGSAILKIIPGSNNLLLEVIIFPFRSQVGSFDRPTIFMSHTMPSFLPNALDTDELSSAAKQLLRGAILIALQNRTRKLHIHNIEDLCKRVGLPASTTKPQLIELLNEARQAGGLFENNLKSEDDFVTPAGSCPVFSAIYIINNQVGFSMSTPMYMLSKHDLNRLLPDDV